MAVTSTVLLDELFETGSSRFLPVLLESRADRKLAAFAERFSTDRRPWARKALLDYIDDGCDRPGHRGLVKRLFKHAERAEDDEAMAHFLVAFDRWIEHNVKTRRRWDWQSRTYIERFSKVRDLSYPVRVFSGSRSHPRFSKVTRLYLQRRALRYLRRLGSRDKVRFRGVAIDTLKRYRDDHREHPVRLIDAWGLMHLLYHGTVIVNRDPRGVRLRPGSTLAQLEPAPMHADAWKDCLPDLLDPPSHKHLGPRRPSFRHRLVEEGVR